MRHEENWGGGAAGGAAAHRRKVSLGGKSSDAGNRCNTTNSEQHQAGRETRDMKKKRRPMLGDSSNTDTRHYDIEQL